MWRIRWGQCNVTFGRGALRVLAVAPLCGLTCQRLLAKVQAMKLGNAPCSWGVFYPTGNRITATAYLDAIKKYLHISFCNQQLISLYIMYRIG